MISTPLLRYLSSKSSNKKNRRLCARPTVKRYARSSSKRFERTKLYWRGLLAVCRTPYLRRYPKRLKKRPSISLPIKPMMLSRLVPLMLSVIRSLISPPPQQEARSHRWRPKFLLIRSLQTSWPALRSRRFYTPSYTKWPSL